MRSHESGAVRSPRSPPAAPRASSMLCSLLLATLSVARPMCAAGTTVKIGALFRERFWAADHLAAAAAAVHRINQDPAILPEVTLELERVNIDALANARGADDPLAQCYVNNIFADEGFANVSMLVGVGYSTDVSLVAPLLDAQEIVLITHSAAAAALSNKTAYPHVARMCRSAQEESRGLMEMVSLVIKHTAIKILSCKDSYCQSCKEQVVANAEPLNITVAKQYDYGEELDVQGSDGQDATRLPFEVAEVITDCREATVVILCTHKNEAVSLPPLPLLDVACVRAFIRRPVACFYAQTHSSCLPLFSLPPSISQGHIMRSATFDPAYSAEHTIFVMGPWQGKSLTEPWSGGRKPRIALSIGVKVPEDDVVAAFRQHVRSSWSDLDRSLTGNDLLSVVNGDEYVRWAYDAVFAFAHALHSMDRSEMQLINSSSLRAALKRVRFRGVGGVVDFNDDLDNLADDWFVEAWDNNSGAWNRLAHILDGELQPIPGWSIRDNITWPNVPQGSPPAQICPLDSGCPEYQVEIDDHCWSSFCRRSDLPFCARILVFSFIISLGISFSFLAESTSTLIYVYEVYVRRRLVPRSSVLTYLTRIFVAIVYGLYGLILARLLLFGMTTIAPSIDFSSIPWTHYLQFCNFAVFFFLQIFVIILVRSLGPAQGLPLVTWIQRLGGVAEDQLRNKNFGGDAHSLGWRFLKSGLLADSSLIKAVPTQVTKRYKFSNVLYYRRIENLTFVGIEIAFEGGLRAGAAKHEEEDTDQPEDTDAGGAYAFCREYCAKILSLIGRTSGRSSATTRAEPRSGIQEGSRWQSVKVLQAVADVQSAQSRAQRKEKKEEQHRKIDPADKRLVKIFVGNTRDGFRSKGAEGTWCSSASFDDMSAFINDHFDLNPDSDFTDRAKLLMPIKMHYVPGRRKASMWRMPDRSVFVTESLMPLQQPPGAFLTMEEEISGNTMTFQTACQISLSLANMLRENQSISLYSPLSTDTIIKDSNGVLWVTDWVAQDVAEKSGPVTGRSRAPSVAHIIPKTNKIAPAAMTEPVALHVYGRPVTVAPELLSRHADTRSNPSAAHIKPTAAWHASIYSLGVVMYTLFTAIGGKKTYPQFVGRPDGERGAYL